MAYNNCTPKIVYVVYEISVDGLMKKPTTQSYYGEEKILGREYESPEAVMQAAIDSGENFDYSRYAIIPVLSYDWSGDK